jgi:hypothetical protein
MAFRRGPEDKQILRQRSHQSKENAPRKVRAIFFGNLLGADAKQICRTHNYDKKTEEFC